MLNRRQFLKGLVAAGGYLAFGGLLPDPVRAAGGKRLPPGLWRGHASALCHDLVRDRGTIPPVVPDRRVKAYIDLYCRSAFGAPSEEVSAFAGLNFYAGEFGDRYTFPGGNGLAAELLWEAIDRAGEGRIAAGATVVSVEAKGAGVMVTYVDRDGELASVEAKAAIVAVPKTIARYIVKGLPEEQRDAMEELRYGSYLVANVLCTAPIAGAFYDTWTDVAPFTDFIVADWVTREGTPKRGNPPHRKSKRQVLTVYYPIGYRHDLLLADDAYDAYRSRIVELLEVLYPGATSKIEDVLLYRWGHALCHGQPGWYTQKAPVASRPLGRIFFAHSDNQGLPAFESALAEGISAAEQAVSLLSRPRTTRHGDFPGGKNRVPKPRPHRIPLSGPETPIVLGEF